TAQDGRVVPHGIMEGGGHDVLGLAVQPVRQGASPGWPLRGEPLVAAPAQQHGLGAPCLLQRDPGRLAAAPGADPADPAAVPEPLVAGRVLDDPVERDVLADDDLSHSGSPSAGAVAAEPVTSLPAMCAARDTRQMLF